MNSYVVILLYPEDMKLELLAAFCHHKREVCLRTGLTEKTELREAERKNGSW